MRSFISMQVETLRNVARQSYAGTMNSLSPHAHLQQFGYALIPGVFDVQEMGALATQLAAALQGDEAAVLKSRGHTYGSRDLISLLPAVCDLPHQRVLKEFIVVELGPDAGLVRALYFDKPPERGWSLPWHKDRTIAVKNNERTSSQFGHPTIKAGVPHVVATDALLESMLTLRIHLDPMTAENGPLCVIPGSHGVGEEAGQDNVASPVELHVDLGDVLAMRPLLSHSSRSPVEGSTMHRRVVHLELAPSQQLPDDYEWQWFLPVG